VNEVGGLEGGQYGNVWVTLSRTCDEEDETVEVAVLVEMNR
jgi:hypothetical protein